MTVKFRLMFEVDGIVCADHSVEYSNTSFDMDGKEFCFSHDRKKAMEIIHCLESWKSERTAWHKVVNLDDLPAQK
ncbi:hypothetical protein [Lonepinella koalarum]|uniref:hypothetical protein n=1 Tax=Lonepinella TaxID=53416 RepID=UPI003F6DBC27